MKHQGTIRLETERLVLRKFKIEDAKDMFNNYASNPNVTKFLTWPPHSDVNVSKEIISSWIKEYSRKNFYQWAIELKELGQAIGGISIVRIDEAFEKFEVGYCIGEKWWHQGITSEALKEVIKFCFEEVGVNKVSGCHDINNPNSGKVMLKCGLQYECTIAKAGTNGYGDKCDLAFYRILRSEYNKG